MSLKASRQAKIIMASLAEGPKTIEQLYLDVYDVNLRRYEKEHVRHGKRANLVKAISRINLALGDEIRIIYNHRTKSYLLVKEV